ncbi:pilus (MSHA type) biogenesis protein MshL [Ferrigenium kumadai]|uniref:Pilus (MSHA type) biogenesis protein MshL n=1 Tax=Ferrigenium kumadai TaxID=1682490 RepID=A0AAN1SXZ3_9PROT|nr:secretin N-terminal domain-containing protein [Ferrigenium kumadai]BBI98656.1 pilus (MSHA type) biogenesis protein MshL [Ferrigenium kumadai]
MRALLWLSAGLLLAGCAVPAGKSQTADVIQREMNQAVQDSTQSKADAVNNALLPPLAAAMPKLENKPLETKFDLSVNNTPASQVFMAIVSGTRYSVLLHPEVGGSISLNLKDVTVFEALEAIREIYGYDYKVDGSRIYIQPLTLQTRLFQVNYLTGQRKGESALRVTSGSVSDNPSATSGTAGTTTTTSSTTTRGLDSSKVSMTSSADFWEELVKALTAIVGNDKGRSVVVSPMTGVIVVRAMPDELKNVAAYLKASQISIERQVILEAKIVEVQLNDGFQSGVNWAAFKTKPDSRVSFGQLGAATTLAPNAAGGAAQSIGNSLLNGGVGGVTTGVVPGSNLLSSAATGGTLFGLAFQTNNFAALLNFLESQGNVHVLSSPRIATLNNQKAVLKVGTDEFFVTNVTSTTTTGTATTTTPSVTLQPFFSGIALDVTPRIDEDNEIILHVHPSVSQVSTVNKTVNVGGVGGTLNLPLASSSVSETDSIVRARDGQIVAIGGLMRQATFDDQSGLPGLPKTVFGQTNKRNEKRELVILLKPTVVDNDKDWSQDITQSRDRFNSMAGSAGKQ